MATAPISSSQTSASQQPGNQANHTTSLAVLTSLFFVWGFMTCLNDILIPHLKAIFTLNYAQASLVQFVFFLAYFIVSMPAGAIIRRIGYQTGIVVGLGVAGVGCLLFYPAASSQSYYLFLLAFFILAAGITILQVAANPYVAILGKPETASARLNLTQAFNALGTTIAPWFGSVLILSAAIKSADEIAAMHDPALVKAALETNARAVQLPYLGLAGVFIVLAVVFMVMKLPRIVDEGIEDGTKHESGLSEYWQTLKFRHLSMGVLGIFFYVGGEVAIGSFLVNYMHDLMGFEPAKAGQYLMFYWGGAMVGRFIGSAVLRMVRPGLLLGLNATVVCLLLLISMTTHGAVAMWTVLLIGLFNSIMFPTIFTLAIDGLGRHTSSGSALLCVGIVGGALLPWITGKFADAAGLQIAFVVPLACYLYIVYYGFKGSIPHRLAQE